MSDGYRTAASRCELCDTEVENTGLKDLAGLRSCARCHGGDLELALRHWGLELDMKHTPRSYRTPERFSIEVKRPTFVEAFARLDRDSGNRGWFGRLFRQRDPEVGDRAFDDQVLIAPDAGHEEGTLALLARPGLRQAVLALVQLGCEIHLTGQSVWVFDRDGGAIDRISSLAQARPLAVVLAVHVERYAREDAR